MVLIYQIDGECIEVARAVRAEVQGGSVCCFDGAGALVASFLKSEVEVFTANPEVADVIKDEACEETSSIPA
jgi:hypothetical protein